MITNTVYGARRPQAQSVATRPQMTYQAAGAQTATEAPRMTHQATGSQPLTMANPTSMSAQAPQQRAGVTGSNTGSANANVTRPPSYATPGGAHYGVQNRGGVAGGSMGGAPQFDQFSQYQDAAYENRMRTLNPQMDDARARFDQQMVGRGIAPGSEAYNRQYANLEAALNDAQNSAHFGAMQFGLGAQNQAFQQQNAMDQLANALSIAQMGNQTQMGISNNNLALQRDRLQQQADQFGQTFGEGQRQFDSNDAYRNNQLDFGQMMALENLGYRDARDAVGDARYNDQLFLAMMGLAPGMGGPGIDVGGAFNIGQNSANARYGAQQQNYQNNMAGLSNLASMGAYFLSDRRLKEEIEHVDTIDGYNVYEFKYKGKPGRYRGVMAQEIMAKVPDAVSMGSDGFYRVDYSKLPVDMEAA